MDEVDIDNVEDLNELEARLYAQIHHEATNESNIQNEKLPQYGGRQDKETNSNDDLSGGSNEVNYETSSNTNRILSKRYWASGEHGVKQSQQHTNKSFIRNPFKPPNQQQTEGSPSVAATNATQIKNVESTISKPDNNKKSNADEQLSLSTSASKKATTSERNQIETPTSSNKTKKTKNAPAKADQNSQQKQTSATPEKSNLKLNPVADWMKRNKNQMNKKSNTTNTSHTSNFKTLLNHTAATAKKGPFAKQQDKLEKAKRWEDKKQKSKKAKNAAAAMAKKFKPTEVIDLDSDNESDSSDVIMIPIPPPPTFTLDDSDDDKDNRKENTDSVEPIILVQEENAVDSTDVQMSTTSSSFIRPQGINQHSISNVIDSAEKRLDNSSRCTSPCSIQSSDDFIGQNDRSRLLTASTSGMADDEDLILLTTDINSLLEVPQIIDTSVEHVEQNDSLAFATPKKAKAAGAARKKDYRVEQSQFRALDVYESESDLTDSVYSKGVPKTTVIRQIDTSSDDDDIEDIASCSQRTKLLRKRRASSSNKESESGNNENVLSSTDNENDDGDDNNVLRTPISFISRGPAVERSKPRKRTRTLSTCSPIQQIRKSAKTSMSTASAGHMSDGEFIATLNNLAQGQDTEAQVELDEEDSESDNAPSARDIAEKILGQLTDKTAENLDDNDMAVPNNVIKELDKVFETIDNMEEKEKQKTKNDDSVNISDSSDSNPGKKLTYKSLPDESEHIISYVEDTTSKNRTPEKKRSNNGSPVYNVIYTRGHRSNGGIGWNEEMRKFYNQSWNGEHFVLKRVLQKLNSDKSLWKIYTEDRFNTKSNRRCNLKCTNCCEFGHMRSKCKLPRKPLICYMCGDSGHHEPRCPNTICLRCGNKTQVFTKSCNACSYQNRLICPICKIRGHSLDFCPDKWRRYHSTTEPNEYPNSHIDYNPKKYCCICGGRGHLSENCRSAVRFMEYPVIISAVKSHQKSYADLPAKSPHGGIGLNLMYEPCQEFQFDLADRTTTDKYYGRFLNAVGLEFMLKRKRRIRSVTTDNTAEKTKRLSTKYIANPYSKVGCANQKDNTEISENAPNQVQEITESGNVDESENDNEGNDIITLEDNSADNDVELVGSTVEETNVTNIQLNTINKCPTTPTTSRPLVNFKSPTTVGSSLVTPTKSTAEPPLIMDSDSNYSFSEHFDVPSTSAAAAALAMEKNLSESQNISPLKDLDLPSNLTEKPREESSIPSTSNAVVSLTVKPHEKLSAPVNLKANVSSRPKPREMEALPDFIPLIDSTEDTNEEVEDETSNTGISRRFVAAESDDEMDEIIEQPRRSISPLPELPCEAKIYLTHFHSKYLLAPEGNSFLDKTSKAFKLKARLDFTSIGHVLVIFGLPTNQDKFQRELLLKYREISDQSYQKQFAQNIPKKNDVLIRFLRDNITQLLSNLGNANQLHKRLKHLEGQQTKSGFKSAEKVRRSLNMILIGQAGLLDGSIHLDKLLLSLKTLMNDYKGDDYTPQQLRVDITNHWKVIFSPYRHENYQKLIETYNKLISKNRVPKLNIDPILLGHKVLDTTLTAEQKEKLEKPKKTNQNTEQSKEVVTNPLNTKNIKSLKRKQTDRSNNNSPPPPAPSSKIKSSTSRGNSPLKTPPPPSMRSDTCNTPTPNISKSSFTTPTSNSITYGKKQARANSPTKTTSASKTNTDLSTPNKSKSSSVASTASSNKKQQQRIMAPPPPFINTEKWSTVSSAIQQVSDKWKSTCDTLLTEISAEPSKKKSSNGGSLRDSRLPSTFWSRESMRYLDNCLQLASSRADIVEKVQRVQNKSKNGQLSYNDYLAVIKLHTALSGK